MLENLALRQQLALFRQRTPHPPISSVDRAFWSCLSQAWPRWRRVLLIVKPETVVGWHRQRFRLFWSWKFRLLGGDLPLDRLSSNVVRDYIQTRQDEGAKDTTVVKEIITLRRAVKLAHEAGRFPASPKEVIPRFRVRYQPRERWLTPKQVRALLRQLEPHRQLWVLLATFAGARLSEVERLRWEHVDLERGWVLLPGTNRVGHWATADVGCPLFAFERACEI